MNNLPPVQLVQESAPQRLLRALDPGYLLALLRSRWRWVLAMVALGAGLGICRALQSPTYQARVVIEDKDVCSHGYLKPTIIESPSMEGQICPHCKPAGAK